MGDLKEVGQTFLLPTDEEIEEAFRARLAPPSQRQPEVFDKEEQTI